MADFQARDYRIFETSNLCALIFFPRVLRNSYINNTNIQNNANPLVIAQSLSVLALALLSIGFFYRNHATKIETLRGGIILKFIGWSCIVGFVFLIPIIYILSNGKTIIPFFMATLAVSLYLGNRVMNAKSEPEESKKRMTIPQLAETPLGRLVLFMVCLAVLGTLIAGLYYFAVYLPELVPINSGGALMP